MTGVLRPSWLPDHYDFISIEEGTHWNEDYTPVPGWEVTAYLKEYSIWQERFIKVSALTRNDAINRLRYRLMKEWP